MAEQAKSGGYWQELREAKDEVLPVHDVIAKRRGPLSRVIVATEQLIARPWVFAALALAHVTWVILNLGVVPGIDPWDPYPFTFLATVASVEAPFLTMLVLMAQQREGRIGELREEMDLQLELHNDRQITEALTLLRAMAEHLKVPVDRDEERARAMEQPVDPRSLLEHVRERLEESEGEDPNRP